ncbi:MAG: hypothetical protein H6828_15965 [Planctomycetes bacterium]|nr:hypothetical protein [Planctomycetota bacterium]
MRTSLLAAVAVVLYVGVSTWSWVTSPPAPARDPTSTSARARDGSEADEGPATSHPVGEPTPDAPATGRDTPAPAPSQIPSGDAPRNEPPRGHVPPPPDDWPPSDVEATADPGDVPDGTNAAAPIERPDAAMRLRPRGEPVGVRLEYVTRLDLELDAEIDVGLFSPSVTYEMRESETLRVERLAPVDGRAAHAVEYVVSRQTRTLPIVGKKQDEHRVHGKSYIAVDDPAGGLPQVTKTSGKNTGKPAPEKDVAIIGRTLATVAGDPPLASVVHGVDLPLDPGDTIALDSQSAKRMLGLPIEQLEVDDVVLVLRSVDGPRGTFDVTARLRGEAELGDGSVGLKGKLAGTCVVLADGARVESLDLKGRISVEQDARSGGMIATSGSGPLAIHRSVSVVDG